MKILAVCGMGLGSSMVLKLTLGKVLAELKLKADVEVTDISSAKSQSADLIVTSAELAQRLSDSRVPIIAIKNYVDRKEMKEKLLAVLDHDQVKEG
ncbi:PTS sugar transporter subunit IIB [bacterium]|nr:MAG: PTS sugar transporter subunit IIB [bacterium]